MLLLAAHLALAAHRVVQIPLTASAPPAGWLGFGVPYPLFASPTAPWSSDFPRVTCAHEFGVLSVQYDLAGPPAYTLPDHVTCRQGLVSVRLEVRFVPPSPVPWMADDGTIILPAPAGGRSWASTPLYVKGLAVAAAETPGDDPSLRCSVADGQLRLDAKDAEAPAEAVCRITPADGGPAVDHRLLLVPYQR